MKTEHIKSKVDGRTLHVRVWSVDSPKAWIQIVHGICEHSGRYEHVAAALNRAGYSVLSHDHRSFGLSHDEGHEEFSIVGHFADCDGWEKAQQDVLNIQQAYATPDVETVLLAHSMGSFLAQSLLQRTDCPYAAVALSGTRGPVKIKDKIAGLLARFERWRCGARAASPVADWFMEKEFNSPFKPRRTSVDWICSDVAVVDAYVADPMCGGTFSTQLACDISYGLSNVYQMAFENTKRGLPIYLFSGEKDAVSQMSRGVRELKAYLDDKSFTNVEMKIYPELRHETLNETSKERVISDLVRWVDRQI